LANLALIATVKADKIQKTNAKGKPLYYKTEVDQTYWAVKEEADIPDAYKTKRITTDINTDAWEDYTPEMIDVIDTTHWEEVEQPKIKVVDEDSWEKTGDNVTPPADAGTYNEYNEGDVATYNVGAKVKVTKGAVITYYKAKVAHMPLEKEILDEHVPEYSDANVPTYTVGTIVKFEAKYYKAKTAHKKLQKKAERSTGFATSSVLRLPDSRQAAHTFTRGRKLRLPVRCSMRLSLSL